VNLALVVPGGVDRSGERRIVPALLSLVERLARVHRVTVFALRQEAARASWTLRGATIENIGSPLTVSRAVAALVAAHRRARFDVIQAIWGGDCALVAVGAARVLGVPAFVHLAGGELVALRDIGYGGRQRALRRRVDGWALHRARVSAASAPMIDAAGRLGIAATRIPLGVDLRAWAPAAPRRRADGESPRLVHVASLNRVKGQEVLLGALARLRFTQPRVRLDIVGEDTLDGEVQRRASELGIADRVTFHGFRTQAQLRPIVEAAHVHVVSSWHEAGPLSALEAAVAGVPTVGTHVGHLAEWLPHAAATCLPGDAVALAAQVERVLDDENLRLSLAAAAQRIAVAEDADFTAARFLEAYSSIGH
jgi:glycosyltransferase involved in cell wall biosynthesis